ncbi:MAG: DUF423 domain-containing protein [Planctomycetota bacterium]|jgi:uncharacterized membrane protein YgdD (TMEM256/DUF423 family)|nr:MAG: DUF423 domain-containing protein [Planctomycetota bacterium]
MARIWFLAGSLLGGIGVAAGAFGAHGLKAHFEANGQAANWETAVRYGLFHALVLLVVAIASALPATAVCRRRLWVSGACFLSGTLIFSGLLAILAFTGLKILGAVVPIGGVLLIAGWGWLFAAGLQLGSES